MSNLVNARLTLPKFNKRGKGKNWKGSNILDRRFFVFGILGKRRSGKSTLVYNLIEKFATKNTIVLFFVHTFHKDENYKEMRDMLDKKGILYQHYDDIVDGVVEFMEEQKNDKQNREDDVGEQKSTYSISNTIINNLITDMITGKTQMEEDSMGTVASSKRKKKPEPLEYIIVFDDVSDSLRETAVKKLIKNSFHYRSKIILATQGHADFSPDIYANLDYLALYKNFNEYALEHIYNKIELTIDFERFKELYHRITDGSYDFLFIDRNNDSFRINLDKKI